MRILASQRDAISALRFWTDGRMATFDFFLEKEKKSKVAWPRTAFSLATQLGRRTRGSEREHTRVSTLQQLCYYFPKKNNYATTKSLMKLHFPVAFIFQGTCFFSQSVKKYCQ